MNEVKNIILWRLLISIIIFISPIFITYGDTIDLFLTKYGYHGLASVISTLPFVILFFVIKKEKWKTLLLFYSFILFLSFSLAEVYQGSYSWIPGNFFDYYDILLHFIGGLVGLFLSYRIVKRKMFYIF